jgi:hypothetical protein
MVISATVVESMALPEVKNPPEEEITVGDSVCDLAIMPQIPNTAIKIKNLLFIIDCLVITILNYYLVVRFGKNKIKFRISIISNHYFFLRLVKIFINLFD